ncbi:MAG: tRNA glutamyl-Q(34) synthetase GluQRS [Thermoanaerobaculia bacterium]
MTVGRFAPSPTGPLHFGSLVAAVGSWLSARARGGRWLVRIEDLDLPRVREGSEREILSSLGRYGLEWDGDPLRQSERGELYEAALARLRERGLVFPCGCTRAELQRAASAPAADDPSEAGGAIYPGTCRNELPEGKEPRAMRFRVPAQPVLFRDRVRGRLVEDLEQTVGDFVLLRADGVWAYQLAVVVDDAEQGVTEVVRGGDLLGSTARQIALQQALGLPTPEYLHLPLVLDADGAKLGKRHGALPLETLDEPTVRRTLALALHILGLGEIEPDEPARMLRIALEAWDDALIPAGEVRVAVIPSGATDQGGREIR